MKKIVKSFMFLVIVLLGNTVSADIKNITILIAVGDKGNYTFKADNGDFPGPKCSLIPTNLPAHYRGECIFATIGAGRFPVIYLEKEKRTCELRMMIENEKPTLMKGFCFIPGVNIGNASWDRNNPDNPLTINLP